MTAGEDLAGLLGGLEAALGGAALPELGGVAPEALDRALGALAARHGAGAVPLLRRLAAAGAKAHRRAARLALYRLERAGVAVPAAAPPPKPVIARAEERPVRAWVSGIDGSGSRGVWILVEGGLGGGLSLCSLILNDEAGILDATGGPTTRRRLDAEVGALSREPGLPWVETDPAHAARLVAEALAVHARAGTRPPATFERWRSALEPAAEAAGPEPPGGEPAAPPPDPALVDRSAELLELPELGGWFVDPGAVQDEALQLLEARESRLVLSDQMKAEREGAIVDAVIERLLTAEARRRWARRLAEMARLLERAGRPAPVALMAATAAALGDAGRSPRAIPFARALALRGLEMAAEVALGRARPAEVSRAPRAGRPT
jgi:hypothetical protein